MAAEVVYQVELTARERGIVIDALAHYCDSIAQAANRAGLASELCRDIEALIERLK